MKLISFVWILGLLLCSSYAVRKAKKSFDDDTVVLVSMPRNDLLQIEITTTTNRSIVLGFEDSNLSVDAFIIEPRLEIPTISDLFLNDKGQFEYDTENNYKIETKRVEEEVTYTVTRKIDTKDKLDCIFKDGENSMFFSSSFESLSEIKDLDTFPVGVNMINRRLDSGGSSSNASEKALLHGLFTYIAWDWFSLLLIVTGRYSKYFYTFRIYVHGVLGLLAVLFNIIGVAFSGIDTDRKSANSLGDVHTGLAGVVSWWAGGVWVIGIICKIAGRWVRHRSYIAVWSRFIHLWAGYLCIIYANFVLLSGLYLYDSPVVFLFYIHVACMIAMLIVIEVCFCFIATWKYEYIEQLHKKNVPEMTIEAFLESEKKLALFDNYVIDMGGYLMDHPGGAYVLQECVKMDLGKYFFGSYSMENWVKPHNHSYIAGKALVKMAIAKIKQPKETFAVFEQRDDHTSRAINAEVKNPEYYTSSSWVFTVPSRHEIIKMVYNIRFWNSKIKVKMFFPGTEMLGKHYVINSLQNNVTRYYTICNAMHTKVYPQYLSVFNSILEGERRNLTYKTFQEMDEAYDEYLELVLKLYPQSKKGITKQLLKEMETDQFFISGPLSRGYHLEKENMTGTTIVFLGGTGVLPFMDLFAYITRKTISQNDKNNEVFPGEKFEDELDEANFIIYGFYPRADAAVGIEFLDKASKIHEKFNLKEKFHFKPTYTRDGGKRLDKEQIFDILGEHYNSTGIKNLWVCGPPPMNNMFQEHKKAICREYQMMPKQIEIL